MVSRLRGGKAAFLETNFRACLKLQKVSGISGYTSKIFTAISLSGKTCQNRI
jgi:hypothetical protein